MVGHTRFEAVRWRIQMGKHVTMPVHLGYPSILGERALCFLCEVLALLTLVRRFASISFREHFDTPAAGGVYENQRCV